MESGTGIGCFQRLANHPGTGRRWESILPELRWFEHGRHLIFYVLTTDGVLVARVLHQSMLPERMRFEI